MTFALACGQLLSQMHKPKTDIHINTILNCLIKINLLKTLQPYDLLFLNLQCFGYTDFLSKKSPLLQTVRPEDCRTGEK